MNPEIVERLELKIAFIEHANAELSDVVYRQQRELETLRLQLDALKDKFEASKSAPSEYGAEEEKPPHY